MTNVTQNTSYEAVVIGASAGGLDALAQILPDLPLSFGLPVVIVQHRAHDSDSFFTDYLDQRCSLTVKEALMGDTMTPGSVIVAPPGYHLLVESSTTLSLSVDTPVKHSMPSIDVLFESAARVFCNKLVGVVLTGANSDGSAGLQKIKAAGGLTVVQDPKTAEAPEMPRAAIAEVDVDHIIPLEEIAAFLGRISRG